MNTAAPAFPTVETVGSLTDIGAAEWNVLTPQDPMASHGWLLLAEEELGEEVETRYLLARQDRRLVGAVPCYLCHRGGRLMDPNQLMFGRFRRLPESLDLSFVPTMLIGPFRSYGPRFLLAEGLDATSHERTLDLLATAVEDLARSRGVSLQIPKISSAAPETLELVTRRPYLLTRDFPVCYLDIEWNDFDGYLGHIRSFSPKMRRNIKEEMNRFRRSGIRIKELTDPGEHDVALLKIIQGHYERLNRASFPFSDDFFVRLKRSLGNEVTFYGAMMDDRLVGFVPMLRRGRTAYLPMTGIDRQWTRNEATYFNLCYYRPIADAITSGLERVYFGGTLYYPKVRRGCKILGLHHAYRGTTGLRQELMRPWFLFHSTWMRRRVLPLEDLSRLRQGSRS